MELAIVLNFWTGKSTMSEQNKLRTRSRIQDLVVILCGFLFYYNTAGHFVVVLFAHHEKETAIFLLLSGGSQSHGYQPTDQQASKQHIPAV